MKKLFILSLLITVLFSCKNEAEFSLSDIRKKIEINPNFVSYSNAMNELMLAGGTQEISFRGADMKLFNQKKDQAKTLEQKVELLERVGVKGARKLAVLQHQSMEAFQKILIDFPELKNLSKQQLGEVLMFKSDTNDKKISELFLNNINDKY